MFSTFALHFVLCAIVAFSIQIGRLLWAEADLNVIFSQYYGQSIGTSLSGKVIWITGASSGIGEQLAYLLCRTCRGMKLILSARKRHLLERVQSRCEELGQNPDDIYIVHTDLRDYETHDGLAWSVVQKFNKIDVLINCAGRGQCSLALDTSLAVDRAALELNTLGTISLIKAVIFHGMKSTEKGQIVYISGLEGKRGMPLASSYSASCKATLGFLESLRFELATDTDIKVSCIYMGPIENADYVRNMYVENLEDCNNDKRRLKLFPKQSIHRSVDLIATAIANELDEAWVGNRQWLIYMYIFQYLPSISRWLSIMKHQWSRYRKPDKKAKYMSGTSI